MSDSSKSKMQDFMIKKNTKETCKDKSCLFDNNTDKLPDKQRSLNQEIQGSGEDVERHLLLARIIHFMVLLPLSLVLMAGVIVLFVNSVPHVLFIIRQVFVKIVFDI